MPKKQNKPLNLKDSRIELALDLAFAGRHSQADIAKRCEVSPRTIWGWLKHPDFQAALEHKRSDFKRSIERVTFADKARRIHALNDAALIALNELETRPHLVEVRPSLKGDVTNEAFNNTALSEFRAALADIAAELGERKNPAGANDAANIRILIETDTTTTTATVGSTHQHGDSDGNE